MDLPVLLYFHQKTGDDRYLSCAQARVAFAETHYKRVAGHMTGCSKNDNSNWTWLSNESCAMVTHSLAALGVYLGKDKYITEAIAHLRDAHTHSFDPTDQLWWHGSRPGTGETAGAKWGRGQGWALYGLARTLEILPENHPEREWLCARLAEVAEGLRSRQDKTTGLWYNVLNDASSGIESCGALIFTEIYSWAWKQGHCRLDFIPEMVKNAWTGAKTMTFNNRTMAWVPGTCVTNDYVFYMTRPRVSVPAFIISAGIRYMEAFGE